MRIAMIGSRGIPAHSGGVERVVQELAGELAGIGHEVWVYARPHYVTAAQAAAVERPGVRVLFTGGVAGKHLDTITHTATAMLDVLRRRDVDIIHVHSPGPAMMNWLPRWAGRKLVLTVHAPDWQREKWSLAGRMMLWAGLKIGMKTATAITAVSQPLAQELSQRFSRPVHYVPNGIGLSAEISMQYLLQYGLTSGDFGLYVGRIVPEKRLDVLIQAWQLSGVDKPLVIIGEMGRDAFGRRCRSLAQRNDKVLVLGEQSGKILAEAYSHAGLVIQPSVLEGMSMVLLEAASYARCALVADIAANQWISPVAVMFPPDDRTQLAEQISRCMKDEALRVDMGQKARQWVVSRFTWANAAKQMEQIYGQVQRGQHESPFVSQEAAGRAGDAGTGMFPT